MRTITIATYSLRVRAKRGDEYEPLGGIDGRYSLADLLEEYLISIRGTQAIDEEAQVVLQGTRVEREGESLWGLLNSGDYGYAAEGIHVRTRRRSYQRTPDDAEIIPFYYRAYLPEMSDLGLLLLQRHGPRGVFTALARGFRAFLETRLPGFLLEVNRVVPSEVMRHLADGEIKAIQVIAHVLPRDITDKLRFLGNHQEVGTFVLEGKAKRNGILTPPVWLRRIRENRARAVELPTDLRGSDATIRIRVDYEGRTRTIDVSDPSNIAPYINATEDLQVDASGHPTFDSIDRYSQELMRDVLQQLGRA